MTSTTAPHQALSVTGAAVGAADHSTLRKVHAAPRVFVKRQDHVAVRQPLTVTILLRLAIAVVTLSVLTSIIGLSVTVPHGYEIVTLAGPAVAFGALGMFSAVIAAVLSLVFAVRDA